MKRKTLNFVWLSLFAVLVQTSAQCAIIFSGPLQSTGGSIEITSDVTFNITSTGPISGIILDQWVTSDGDPSALSLSGPISFSINGGALQSGGLSFAYDNESPYLGFGDVTGDDGAIQLSGISVNAGDTLTLTAQTFNVIFGDAGWNPEAIQSFEGDVFLAGFFGNAMSDVITIPEPSSSAIIVCLAVTFVFVIAVKQRHVS